MSFGHKNPFSYKHPQGLTVKHPESYDKCQICGKETPPKDGFVPVAACVVPKKPYFDEDQVVVLTCASCYNKHNKLEFRNLLDFVEARVSKVKRGRPVGSGKTAAELVEHNGEIKSRVRVKAAKRLSDSKNPLDTMISELEELGKLFNDKLKYVIALHREAMDHKVNVVASDVAPVAPVTDESLDDENDDDFDFGMTEEQRARFEALKSRGPRPPAVEERDIIGESDGW